jgi:F-type H+-transporting ATPase subunit a
VSRSLSSLTSAIHHEVKLLRAGGYTPGASSIFLALLVTIIVNNFLGLFPYVFTATSHILVTLSLALPLWFGFIRYG